MCVRVADFLLLWVLETGFRSSVVASTFTAQIILLVPVW